MVVVVVRIECTRGWLVPTTLLIHVVTSSAPGGDCEPDFCHFRSSVDPLCAPYNHSLFPF